MSGCMMYRQTCMHGYFSHTLSLASSSITLSLLSFSPTHSLLVRLSLSLHILHLLSLPPSLTVEVLLLQVPPERHHGHTHERGDESVRHEGRDRGRRLYGGGGGVEDAGSHGHRFSRDVTCSSSREMCYLDDMSGAEAQESTSAALAALEAEVSRMQVRGMSGHSGMHVV